MTTTTTPASPSTDRVTPFGTHAVLVSVAHLRDAQATATHLRGLLGAQVASVVPGAESVLVHARPGLAISTLCDRVTAALGSVPAAAATGETVTIPVRYDGADLAEVADLLGVSVEEVVARHTGPEYEVGFLGFAPGFPYLTGLDPFLAAVPRLSSPRTRVPAGSVGLAAGQTCVYPSVSPGGWRLLGATSIVLFDPANETAPALLAPGDRVRFEAVR